MKRSFMFLLFFIFLPLLLCSCQKKKEPEWREAYGIYYYVQEGYSSGIEQTSSYRPVYVSVTSDKELTLYLKSHTQEEANQLVYKLYVYKYKDEVKYYTINFLGEKSDIKIMDRDWVQYIDYIEIYE